MALSRLTPEPPILFSRTLSYICLSTLGYVIDPNNPGVIVTDVNGNNACAAGATPFACDVSVNGPRVGNISRNTFRRLGAHYENMNVTKSFALRESMKLTFSAGLFDVFNHPNLYVGSFSNDVFVNSFNGFSTPGVIATRGQSSTNTSFQGIRNQDNREIVLGLKLSF